MLKVFNWIALEVLFMLLSFGIVLPLTVSAANTFLVTLGFLYLLFVVPYVGFWYIPMRVWRAYRNATGENLNEKVISTYGIRDDESYSSFLQQSPPRKRGNPSKQPRK